MILCACRLALSGFRHPLKPEEELPFMSPKLMNAPAIISVMAFFLRVSGSRPSWYMFPYHITSWAKTGLTIFLLPILTSIRGETHPLFALVGIGGALIGIGGLLLSFLKTGRPILSKEKILKVLPGLLLLMTICFVAGFKYG